MDRFIANVIRVFVPSKQKRKVREYFGMNKLSPLRPAAQFFLPKVLPAELHNAVVFECSGGLTDQIRTICFARFFYENWQGEKPQIVLNLDKIFGSDKIGSIPLPICNPALQGLLSSQKRTYDASGKRLKSTGFELAGYKFDWSWVTGFVTLSRRKVALYELFGRHYRLYGTRIFTDAAYRRKISAPIYIHSYPDFELFESPSAAKFLKSMNVTLNGLNFAKLDEIKKTNRSVCVHIRRGDYIAYKKGKTLSSNYFKKAVTSIISQTGWEEVTLFVFSDDWDWACQAITFRIPDVRLKVDFVRLNDISEPIPELELMRACKHFVISAGNFARMAAEMADNKDKIMIKPSKSDFVKEQKNNQNEKIV